MDVTLLLDMMNIDSTSGRERELADFLAKRLAGCGAEITMFPADAEPGQPVSLLLSWGKPDIVFCTHLDTVPPYIPPTIGRDGLDSISIKGRGACDAKGQIFCMFKACCRLAQRGHRGFGLLLLYGEETGSLGAKAYRDLPGGKVVVVGEPTRNRQAKASKGTKAFQVTIEGKSAHSGYPERGESAVERFVDFVSALRSKTFPTDPVLGDTTYNIGMLSSPNPQNILSPEVTCRVYFRTTFASDAEVVDFMLGLNTDHVHVESLGGDTPSSYFTLRALPTCTVAFGSDAPQLTNFEHKMLCGPGSILVAHTADEYVTESEMVDAIDVYCLMFEELQEAIRDKKL